MVVWGFFKYRERHLINEKIRLEQIVTARTAEVVASREKIEAQKDLLQLQKMEITDSINYSRRIQNAILPELQELSDAFPESFILYRPKDIVSGDFYYFRNGGRDGMHVAVADCTGHGVPGAFMSMIGSRELSESIDKKTAPSEILRSLNRGIRKTLRQSNPDTGIRDGMDIALVLIRKNNDSFKVSYSGANRPLWILKNDGADILEIKGTKAAIGGLTPDEQRFDEESCELQHGDILYLFSDGYADQFGGDSGKKIMTRKFRELILECRGRSMQEQQDYLWNFFGKWKGAENEQVDDVLVIGIKL
jgi:serine phosphatase RsbU (regulator of sigma subunit)